MITYAEALAMLLREAEPIHETETIPLMYSTGRVLAEDVTSMIDVPGWDNSQMDGYCLRAADLASASENAPVRLPVAERIAAGKVGAAIEPGTCARIFTGAPLPEGADTVVPQEEVEREGDLAVFSRAPKKGAWVRLQGSDVAAGSVILNKGVRMTPGAIGMTASIGRAWRTASSGRNLQLEPLHDPKPPHALRLRGDGFGKHSRQPGGHEARARARGGNVGRHHDDGRHVRGRRGSHQACG